VRGSKSDFLTFSKSSSDRITLPGESDPGLGRFRGESGDSSRLRFSGGNSEDEVEADKGSVEVVDAEDMFEFGADGNGPDGGGRIGIA